MKRKILSLLIIITMIFGMLPIYYVSAADTTVTITADKETAEPGDEITYTVSLQSAVDVGTATLTLNIPEGLTYVSESGTFDSELKTAIENRNKYNEVFFEENLTIGIFDVDGYSFTNNTQIATFKCTVDSDAKDSKTVNFSTAVLADAEDQDLTVSVQTATVTIESNVAPTGLTLSKNTLTLANGKSETITAEVLPEDATNKNVRWTSSDNSVASVSNGTITAKGKGTATITATSDADETIKDTCTVTVTQPVTSIFIMKDSSVCHELSMDLNEQATLVAEVNPSDADNKTVTWISSDEEVATVNNNGVVTAVGKGTATITVKSLENEEIKATCTVTVGVGLDSISLNETEATIKNGDNYTFEVTYNPEDTDVNKAISWSSSDPEVATVDDNGKVTVHKCTGTATITATLNADNTKTASAVVTAAHKDDELTLHEAKDATCTEKGNTAYYTCSGCQDYYEDATGSVIIEDKTSVEIAIDENAHDWDEGEVTTEPTCTEKGVKTYTCTRDASHTKTEEIEVKGHTMEMTEAKDATCTEEGNIEYYHCTVCDKYFEDETGSVEITLEDTVIEALGHDWGEWEETIPATTTSEGEETRVCKNDDSHKETRVIPMIHVHELQKTEAKEATCTEEGNIEYWTCTVCNKTFSDSEGETEVDDVTIAIDSNAHDWNEWTTTSEPTCTEEGSKERTCKLDSSHKETEAIAKLPHTLTKIEAVDATCEEDGNIAYYTCSECNKYFEDETGSVEITLEDTVIDALGHDWDEGTITTPKTCTTDGVKTYTCKNDDSHTKTETIPAGHEWGEWVVTKEPTVDEEGSKTRTCTLDSSHTETETIARLPYEIVSGDNQVIETEENKDLVIKANGSLDKFVKLLVDGVEVDEENYTLESGSTIVTLKTAFLNTLSAGNHTLTFVYNDGSVDANFRVASADTTTDNDTSTTTNSSTDNNTSASTAKSNPKTGDRIMLWITILGISTLGLVSISVYKKRK